MKRLIPLVTTSFTVLCSLLCLAPAPATRPGADKPAAGGAAAAPAAERVTRLNNPNEPKRVWGYHGTYIRTNADDNFTYSVTGASRYQLGKGRRAFVLDAPMPPTDEYVVLIYRTDAAAGGEQGADKAAPAGVREYQAEEAWIWNAPRAADVAAALPKFLSLSTDEQRRAAESNELKGKAFIREKDGLPQRVWFDRLTSVKTIPDDRYTELEAKGLKVQQGALADLEKKAAKTHAPEDLEAVQNQRDWLVFDEVLVKSGSKAATTALRDIGQQRAAELDKVVAAGGGNAHVKQKLKAYRQSIDELNRRLAVWDDHVSFSECEITGYWRDKTKTHLIPL